MLKNGFQLLFIFTMSAGVAMAFQNCGGSTIKANKSNNDGLVVTVTPDENENDATDNGGDNTDSAGGENFDFTFNLGDGDNIQYVDESVDTTRIRSVKLYGALYDTVLESRIHTPTVINPSFELPSAYCANSAFAHCKYQRTVTCQGTDCPTNRPVACIYQRRLENPEISSSFQLLNNLKFLTRNLQSGESVDTCDKSNVNFLASDRSLKIALADRQCVADQGFYASEGGPQLKNLFDDELTDVQNLGHQCNSYSVYSWNTTNWSYRSQNGSLNNEFREVDYSYGVFKLKWKNSNDSKTYCVERLGAQSTTDYDILGFATFFPEAGLPYKILLTNQELNNSLSTEITYIDPIDEGLTRRFFLDDDSAKGNRGGAVLASGTAQAMKNHIEALINRAVSNNFQQECN